MCNCQSALPRRSRTLLDEILGGSFLAAPGSALFSENGSRAAKPATKPAKGAKTARACASSPEKRRFFAFPPSLFWNAYARQGGICAGCQERIKDVISEAHHLIPVQCADPKRPDHGFIRTLDNCLLLCNDCHLQLGHTGNYAFGAIPAPSSYRQIFPHVFGKRGIGGSAYNNWLRRATANFYKVFPR